MAVKKKSAGKKAAKKAVKIPRQRSLPGMGDKKIVAIENRCLDYAEKLDERKQLATDCKELKKEIHDLMRKAGKTSYNRAGITVVLMEKEETVKLRVRDEEEIHAADKRAKSEPPRDDEIPPLPDQSEPKEEEEEEEEEVPEVRTSQG